MIGKRWLQGASLTMVLGAMLVVSGSALALFLAPPERHMGDVSRIFYIHFPVAINALLIFSIGFVFAVVSLWTSKPRWDSLLTATLETGIMLNVLLLVTGSIFARPTWGVWWTWDVRLTTSLVSLILFAGIVALRSFIEEERRRATWTAVATIIAYVDVPLIYFCVRWWRSLHQVQSSPETVDSRMHLPLRLNLTGVLILALGFIALRATIEALKKDADDVPEPARVTPSVSPV